MSIQQVLQWITELHPSYPEEIRGCSDEDIALLERANGRELPPVYREFLKLMGNDAALPQAFLSGFPAADVKLGFKQVLKASKKMKFRLPDRFTRVGVHVDDPYEDVFLDAEPVADSPRIVRFIIEANEPESMDDVLATNALNEAARTLEDLVFSSAIVSHVFPRYPVQLRAFGGKGEDDAVPRAAKTFERLGCTRHPALRATSRYVTRTDGVALMFQEDGHRRLFIEVHTQSLAEARRVVPHLRELGLVMRDPVEKG